MKCKRCGGDFPHKRGTYCGECEPDARPVGEMRDAEREAENEVLHLALRLANWDPPSVMDLKDAPLLEEHARALAAYRDACKAEARAALLRDAPRVWVAMNQDASAWFHARPVHYAQDEYDGEWRWVEDQPSGGYYPAPSWLVEALGLTPGTVRRAYLVILDGEDTPT